MDRRTFSSYGWIICVIVVLAIMISLATPFGKYITGGVQSVLKNENSTMLEAMPPTMLDGSKQVYVRGEEGNVLSFRSSASLNTLQEVRVDGMVVDPSNYTATSGSTIITFTDEYADSLSNGNHTIGIVHKKGTATAKFSVVPQATITIETSYADRFLYDIVGTKFDVVKIYNNGTCIDTLSVENGQVASGRNAYTFDEGAYTNGDQIMVEMYDNGSLVDIDEAEYYYVNAYALLLNNGNSTYSMSFVKSDTTIKAGDTYTSDTYGALPVTAVYTGFETDVYAKAANAPWASYRAKITSVAVEDEIMPLSTANWFASLSKCVTADVSLLNTKNTTSMRTMFVNSSALTSLDVSNWNTDNVTDMYGVFYGCSALTSLDVSNWNTSNVTNLYATFYNCSALTSLDVSDWDVSNVTTMFGLFSRCKSLESLDVSNWDTGSVENMNQTFSMCAALTSLDVSRWNTGNVTDMSMLFGRCTSLTALDVSNWNTSKVTTMESMFAGNDSMADMKLAELDVSSWDTSSVTNMLGMFYGCGKITELDLSNWDVSNVTNMGHMFADCSKLQSIEFGTWESGNAVSMDCMFNDCVSLTTIDASTWDTSANQAFSQMFEGCTRLKEIIGLENFNTSSAETFEEMFRYCSALTSLDLSNFDTRNATDDVFVYLGDRYSAFGSMLSNMTSLQEIKFGENFCFTGDGTATPFVMLAPQVSGNDGNWYTADGTAYAPENIQSCTANTYYALPPQQQ